MTHAAMFDRSDFEEIADGVELAIFRMPPAVRDEILSLEALEFVAGLQREFGARRLELLDARIVRQDLIDVGGTLDFLPETAEIRADSWQVAPPAPGLLDRRVEITGPTDAKMTINALNSGAKVWLADFEDANTPAVGEHGQRPPQPALRDRRHLGVHLP